MMSSHFSGARDNKFRLESEKITSQNQCSSGQSSQATYTQIVFHDQKDDRALKLNKNRQTHSHSQCQKSQERKNQCFYNMLKISSLSKPPVYLSEKEGHKQSIFINEKLNQNIEVKHQAATRPKSACLYSMPSPFFSKSSSMHRKENNIYEETNFSSFHGGRTTSTGKTTKKEMKQGRSPHYSVDCFQTNPQSNSNLSSFICKGRLSSKKKQGYCCQKGGFGQEQNIKGSSTMSEKELTHKTKDFLKNYFCFNGRKSLHKKKITTISSASQLFFKGTYNGRPTKESQVKSFFAGENNTKPLNKKSPMEEDTKIDPLHKVWNNNPVVSMYARAKKKKSSTAMRKKKHQNQEISQPHIFIEQVQVCSFSNKRQLYGPCMKKVLTNKQLLDVGESHQFKRSGTMKVLGRVQNDNEENVFS